MVYVGKYSSTMEHLGFHKPIGSMYGIYANTGGISMVNVTIYGSTMDPMDVLTSHPIEIVHVSPSSITISHYQPLLTIIYH